MFLRQTKFLLPIRNTLRKYSVIPQQERTTEQIAALKKWSIRFGEIKKPPKNIQAWTTTLRGANVGLVSLPGQIFNETPRIHVVQQVYQWQLANRREGNAYTKTKGEVKGTGRKPYPQKGRGRARHGSLRNPQFRGGGVAHGPRGTNWHYTLSSKIKALGYRVALSIKFAQGNLSVIDKVPELDGKTNTFHFHLTNRGCGIHRKVLLICKDVSPLIDRGLMTLPYAKPLAVKDINMYDLLRHREIIIEKEAIELLQRSLSPSKKIVMV